MTTQTVQQWICESCGFIYDPAEGDPDGGIPPGTAFEDIPADWYAPSAARARPTSSRTRCEQLGSGACPTSRCPPA